MAFCPIKKLIVTGSSDNSIKIWDLKLEILIKTFDDHIDSINCIDISRCGKKIASGSHDKTVKIWDFDKEKYEKTY